MNFEIVNKESPRPAQVLTVSEAQVVAEILKQVHEAFCNPRQASHSAEVKLRLTINEQVMIGPLSQRLARIWK